MYQQKLQLNLPDPEKAKSLEELKAILAQWKQEIEKIVAEFKSVERGQ